jgi:hypothetical protein
MSNPKNNSGDAAAAQAAPQGGPPPNPEPPLAPPDPGTDSVGRDDEVGLVKTELVEVVFLTAHHYDGTDFYPAHTEQRKVRRGVKTITIPAGRVHVPRRTAQAWMKHGIAIPAADYTPEVSDVR